MAAQPRRLVQHVDHHVAPLPEDPAALGHEVLRPLERRDRCRLADRAGVGRALRLDLGHRADQLGRAAGIADPPAGHGIGLGDAVHGEAAIAQPRLERGGRDELHAVVEEVLVDVVGQHPDVRVGDQHVGQRAQLVGIVGGTGRIVGRVQDEPLGARRDRPLEVLRAHPEAVLLGAGARSSACRRRAARCPDRTPSTAPG